VSFDLVMLLELVTTMAMCKDEIKCCVRLARTCCLKYEICYKNVKNDFKTHKTMNVISANNRVNYTDTHNI
jgi:hypothetical protein